MNETARVAEVLDAYLLALEAGNAPNREALLARHPDLAEELDSALDGLDFVHRAGTNLAGAPRSDEDAAPGKALGDYRLLREIGRGGMAVVYEAEQVSLGRHVALKVLPFAAVLDPKHLQRFKNEAMAAAHLRHPHIVPVYGVGCERGVHYYAMQYIEGESLAIAIREMKGGGGLGSSDDTGPAGTGKGRKTPISSHGSSREPAYVRMAAALGMQAAEALDHAHQMGIVHRDIKPGNLLVDAAGTLWVTDFGLACSVKDVGLTITGELLGTIRYMSPEQALAKRVPMDHRTDIYSLGATLYELFTLEPAFPGDDPNLVMQDIAFKDPVPPRRLNPALPLDLETVLIKAMTKDPGGRYATAQEMADDIRRYLEDKPILARRPSLAARAARWSRRHRGLVAASFVVVFLALAALAVDSIRVGHEEKKTRAALQTAKANLALARNAVEKFLVEAGIADLKDAALPRQARKAMLEAALEFYETYIDDPDSLWRRGEILHALHRYEETLAVFDRVLAIRPEDARALTGRGHQLWHLKRAGDALVALDRAIEIDPTSADAHLHRGNALCDLGRSAEAIAAFDRAFEMDPGFTNAHSNRGAALQSLGRYEEALAAFDRAIEIDPKNANAHSNRGAALESLGRHEEAVAAYREAIRIAPGLADAHYNLGNALSAKGDPDAAIPEYREAIRLNPDYAEAYCNLGAHLSTKGDFDAAIVEFREAIRLNPDNADAHYNLGHTLNAKGDADGAIASYREAIRLKPDHAEAHYNLGHAHFPTKGDADAAIPEYREAIRLKPDHAEAHCNLGAALFAKGDPDAAILECREAIRLRPDWPEPHSTLGNALLRKGDPDGAIRAYEEAIRIRPDYAPAHRNLGNVLFDKGDLDGAIREFREFVRLRPDDAEAHWSLGDALTGQGRFREALPWLRKGHELGSKRPDWPYPSKEWVESAERKAELEGRLDAVLSGEARPRDALERIEFAELLYAKSRHAESARMYTEAFAENPPLAEDLAMGSRYNAACTAALAAARGAADAAEWRGRALDWLRADLAAREKAASGLADMLEHWKRDADLAAVRDDLARLPTAEREGWTKLWADVDALLARARKG